MVKQTQDTPPRPTPPKGIREVKDGIPSKSLTVGCSRCAGEWGKCKHSSSNFVGIQTKYPWPKTEYENELLNKVLELESKRGKLPWYPFLIGVAAGTLIWTFIFKIFGG